jgi:hypothetical protein
MTMNRRRCLCVSLLAFAVVAGAWRHASTDAQEAPKADALETRFAKDVQPLFNRFCYSCHGGKKPEAQLDLKSDRSIQAILKNARHWELVLDRLKAKEMPPEDATRQPTADERTAMIIWLRDLLDREAARNAGDPGIVLARRLSNAEYDYTIRDLTGIDIRPTREFPVDPANQAGFDNTGESLTMSPALLKKYLAAARHVADHVVFKPEGFVFAPHPMVAETDRDKYCVQRIMDFYKRHPVDYADYFQAAWRYRWRARDNRGDAKLSDFASEAKLSADYLDVVWTALQSDIDVGPMGVVRRLWQELPALPDPKDDIRKQAVFIRDTVVNLRKQLKVDVKKLSVNGMSQGAQPIVLWRNQQFASKHRSYAGDVAADLKKLSEQIKDTEPGLRPYLAIKDGDKDKAKKSLERFCAVFPGAFVVTDRGPYFAPNQANKDRPLTAGFHLMQGFFRDDQPLYDLILNDAGRREIDGLWHELNFITDALQRQYADFIFFERAEPPRFMFEAEFDFARSEDKDCTSQAKIDKLTKLYLAKAKKNKASDEAIQAIESYFKNMSAGLRKVEKARLNAEPSHLESLLKFADRAYRRPLSKAERDDLVGFYRKLRKKDELSHEDAIRDTLASVLLSPHFCFRYVEAGVKQQPLSDNELASRLSYFLWSSMPDAELLDQAAKGNLHKPEVLKAQTRRMLRDPKVRGLVTEFGGNWLDIRRFEEHNAVDRQRFPSFTNDLRQAMFDEPIRYLIDVAQNNRPVLDLLYGKDTFVNSALAKHYGMPTTKKGADEWIRVDDANQYGRGGLLPMAVFLTKNAPGLRTSPVKRGYWVVRRVLGEQIPPPPPTVPELPQDEAKFDQTLAQALARHRNDKACAGCHNRFDAVGLVFENFGPIGERRTKDLGGRAVEIAAMFPDGKERKGIQGLQAYLKEKRQDDFVDNLCKKLLAYGLGRSLQLSDRKTLEAMKANLATDEHRFGSLVESVVMSPQFLNKRGREPQ